MIEKLEVRPKAKYEKWERPLKVGFSGVSERDRQSLDWALASGLSRVVALAESDRNMAEDIVSVYRGVALLDTFDELLGCGLDGLVIAGPSHLHASRVIAALERGIPVFSRWPLGLSAAETEAVVTTARRLDRLLGVDFPYRMTEGMQQIRDLIRSGEMGEILAIEAVYHLANGPSEAWSYSRARAGGGCLFDLGAQLLDLALWSLDFPEVISAQGSVRDGTRGDAGDRVDDNASGFVRLQSEATLQFACSWGRHVGGEADLRIQFFGTRGSAVFENIGGELEEFFAERFHASQLREPLSVPPDSWKGRAFEEWLHCLNRSMRFDPEICHVMKIAGALDRLYFDNA
jgi:predicted dehydrogenase